MELTASKLETFCSTIYSVLLYIKGHETSQKEKGPSVLSLPVTTNTLTQRVVEESSTTLALLEMIHCWTNATDGNGSSVRTILFDYRKAFDLIDHKILITKLSTLNLPHSIINWIIDFLTNRQQRTKLAEGCVSEWGLVPSGVPQHTYIRGILGPGFWGTTPNVCVRLPGLPP